MSQRLSDSALEAATNIIVGFLGSWALTFVVLPLVGLKSPTATQALGMTVAYTVWSLVRTFALRRAFIAWGRG